MTSVLRNRIRGMRECLRFSNPIELCAALTIFRHTKLKVYRIGSYEFICDHAHGDENSIRAAVATSMYRELLAKISGAHSPTVIDIGANAGGFVALLLEVGRIPGKIWAVEMNPSTYQRLAFNLAHNLGGRAFPLHLAIAGSNGVLQLRLGRGSTSDSIYLDSSSTESAVSNVRALTFDAFWDEHVGLDAVDICKIDIEGAEYDMLLEGKAERLRQCRWLVIETHARNGRQHSEIYSALESKGFECLSPRETKVSDTVVWMWRNRVLALAKEGIDQTAVRVES